MDKLTTKVSGDQNVPSLDFSSLDSDALAVLDGTALGAVAKDVLKRNRDSNHSKHSSHSSYTEYSTYSMGPIG